MAVRPINPILDAILRLLLVLELARQIHYCYTQRSSNPDQFRMFVICFGVTIAAIVLSKKLFRFLGAAISAKKADDPLSNAVTMKKWEDQGWQWVIHVTMTACEVYLLSYGEGRKWFQDYDSVGCPDDYDISWELENFVLLQLTIWLVTGFSCTFFEERRKDYLEMMFHHVLTNLIIGTAIVNKEHGWALLILFVHDSSDVLVDTLKLSNYMKYEGPKYFFLSEICFVTLVYCVWPLCRMYMYPAMILSVFQSLQWKCSTPNEFTYDVREVELWITVRTVLLLLLLGLHCFWWVLFNKITYSIVVGGAKGSDAGNAEYEGGPKKKK